MSSDWINTTIGEQIQLQRGVDITKRDFKEGTIPVVSSGGIGGFHNTFTGVAPGVILGRKGLVGSVYYLSTDYWAHNTTLWVKNFKGNHPKYIYYFFQSMTGTLKNLDVGSANPTLNRNHVHPIETRWAPIEEQKSIAHILGTLDEKIELNRKTNETLEAMAKALFKSWFVDFDPVKAKAEGRPTGLPAEISDLFPDSFEDSELGEIPSGWRISCVSDICETTDYVANGSFESLKQNVERVDAFSGSEALLLRFTDFNRDWKGDFSFITRESFEFLSKSKVLPGDVVICNVGEVGAFFRAPNLNLLMSLGPNSVLFKDFESKSHLTREFFFFLIGTNAFQANISAISSGSVQTKFNKTSLRAVPVLLPSNTLIRISSDFFKSILSKVDSLFCKTRTLVDLRDALLPKLISGEIRIPDAEKMLEEVGI